MAGNKVKITSLPVAGSFGANDQALGVIGGTAHLIPKQFLMGNNGENGSSGSSGSSGCSGSSGSSGSSGTRGSSGSAGTSGTNGSSGTRGSSGSSGMNNITITNQSSNYTLVYTDKSRLIAMTSNTDSTVTIPLESAVPFEVGDQILIIRDGIGEVSIAGSGGVTIHSANNYLRLNYRYSWARLIKMDANSWYLIGEMKA